MKKIFVVVVMLGCLLAALWPASPAYAHAVLVQTDPAADEVLDESPARVTATFNEGVELAFGAMRVYDTDGERVDAGESGHLKGDTKTVSVPLEPDLPDGTYTATYRVVSADGHPVEAAFVFHVGQPGERPQGIGETLLSGGGGSGPLEQALYGVARWMLFAGITLLVGGFAFLAFVWVRAAAPLAEDIDARFVSRWRSVVSSGWWLTLIASVLGFVLQGAVAADVSLVDALFPSIAGELLGTRYGQVALVRSILLVLLAAAWLLASRKERAGETWPLQAGSTVGAAAATRRVPASVAISGGILLFGLAATPGLSGHAGATEPVWLNVPADTLHVAFAGAWIGGLLTLLVCGYRAVVKLPAAERVGILAPVVSRYSDLALIAVAVLVVTGVYRSWVEVQALRAFVEAPYGWVLLTKLAVFVPLLVLGAVNNRLLKPRIARTAATEQGGDGALRTLRRSVVAEVALGAVILGLTALLVNLSPARVEAGLTGPFIEDVALDSHNLNVVVDPNEVGENLVHLTATTEDGAPAEIQAMRVRFSMPEQDIGPLTAKAERVGPGHFVVQGRQLSIAGDWLLEVEARIDKFTNERAEVEVTVNP